MQPRLLQLRRLVIGEAGRFPELGRTFYELGPGRTIAALASAFEGFAERGLLELDDAALAAAHFNWLIMSIPLNQAMLFGDDDPPASGGPRPLRGRPACACSWRPTGAEAYFTTFSVIRIAGAWMVQMIL